MHLRQSLHSCSFVVILCLLSSAVEAKSPITQAAGNQLSFSYWNDNFEYQYQLARIRPPGDDDHMTASFRLQLAHPENQLWRSNEVYYAIFTDREHGIRFDMLAFRRSLEKESDGLNWKLGYGLLLRGDLGGDIIQNAYHDLMGYEPVDLEQVDGYRLGILGLAKIAYRLKVSRGAMIQSYLTSNLRLGAGPIALRAGLESRIPWSVWNKTISGSMDTRVGYVNYLWANQLIKPSFNKGVVFGIMLNLAARRYFGVSLWYAENQYGLNDPHYGITLHYRPANIHFGGFTAILFP